MHEGQGNENIETKLSKDEFLTLSHTFWDKKYCEDLVKALSDKNLTLDDVDIFMKKSADIHFKTKDGKEIKITNPEFKIETLEIEPPETK